LFRLSTQHEFDASLCLSSSNLDDDGAVLLPAQQSQ
jgi:hypothetical protein